MQKTWGTGSDTINVRGGEMVLVRSRASPGRVRFSLSQAFHAPHRLSIDDVRVLGEVVCCAVADPADPAAWSLDAFWVAGA